MGVSGGIIRINEEEDIDFLIVAEKDGVEEHFVVEVKVELTHSDVDALLAKTDLYESKVGVRPRAHIGWCVGWRGD